MSVADLLTTQILRGDITVEQAQKALMAYAHRVRPKLEGKTLAEIEDHAICAALIRHDDDVMAAALELGISRTTLYRRLGKVKNGTVQNDPESKVV